jgi:hypothetical protein
MTTPPPAGAAGSHLTSSPPLPEETFFFCFGRNRKRIASRPEPPTSSSEGKGKQEKKHGGGLVASLTKTRQEDANTRHRPREASPTCFFRRAGQRTSESRIGLGGVGARQRRTATGGRHGRMNLKPSVSHSSFVRNKPIHV